MGLFHRDSKTGAETPIEVENVVADDGGRASAPAVTPSADLAKLHADLAERDRKIAAYEAEKAEAVKARAAEKAAAIRADGRAFAEGLVKSNHIMPSAAAGLADLHAFAHLAAAGLPADGFDPAASFRALAEGLVPHSLTKEAIEAAAKAEGATVVLSNGGDDSPKAREAKASADLEAYYARQGVKPDARAV